jgi:hypothetical protein
MRARWGGRARGCRGGTAGPVRSESRDIRLAAGASRFAGRLHHAGNEVRPAGSAAFYAGSGVHYDLEEVTYSGFAVLYSAAWADANPERWTPAGKRMEPNPEWMAQVCIAPDHACPSTSPSSACRCAAVIAKTHAKRRIRRDPERTPPAAGRVVYDPPPVLR